MSTDDRSHDDGFAEQVHEATAPTTTLDFPDSAEVWFQGVTPFLICANERGGFSGYKINPKQSPMITFVADLTRGDWSRAVPAASATKHDVVTATAQAKIVSLESELEKRTKDCDLSKLLQEQTVTIRTS